MLRFLKYIFLIFGSLALLIMTFFFLQNKHDLMTAYDSWDKLSYDGVKENCTPKPVIGEYYYPCFREEFKNYLPKVGLTGVSIGLKLAFNFMDEDKEKTNFFRNDTVKQMHYSLNYLELNNLAIQNSYRHFYGFSFMYGGYLSSLGDFLKGAKEFSHNLFEGLKGEEGIESISLEDEKDILLKRLIEVERNYKEEMKKAEDYLQAEIDKFKKEHQE